MCAKTCVTFSMMFGVCLHFVLQINDKASKLASLSRVANQAKYKTEGLAMRDRQLFALKLGQSSKWDAW